MKAKKGKIHNNALNLASYITSMRKVKEEAIKMNSSNQNESKAIPNALPPQHEFTQPGYEYVMEPRPISEDQAYKGSQKLTRKSGAIITGGDSGIGRAAAYAFAKEGAKVVIVYLNEHTDAKETEQRMKELGERMLIDSR